MFQNGEVLIISLDGLEELMKDLLDDSSIRLLWSYFPEIGFYSKGFDTVYAPKEVLERISDHTGEELIFGFMKKTNAYLVKKEES